MKGRKRGGGKWPILLINNHRLGGGGGGRSQGRGKEGGEVAGSCAPLLPPALRRGNGGRGNMMERGGGKREGNKSQHRLFSLTAYTEEKKVEKKRGRGHAILAFFLASRFILGLAREREHLKRGTAPLTEHGGRGSKKKKKREGRGRIQGCSHRLAFPPSFTRGEEGRGTKWEPVSLRGHWPVGVGGREGKKRKRKEGASPFPLSRSRL